MSRKCGERVVICGKVEDNGLHEGDGCNVESATGTLQKLKGFVKIR